MRHRNKFAAISAAVLFAMLGSGCSVTDTSEYQTSEFCKALSSGGYDENECYTTTSLSGKGSTTISFDDPGLLVQSNATIHGDPRGAPADIRSFTHTLTLSAEPVDRVYSIREVYRCSYEPHALKTTALLVSTSCQGRYPERRPKMIYEVWSHVDGFAVVPDDGGRHWGGIASLRVGGNPTKMVLS